MPVVDHRAISRMAGALPGRQLSQTALLLFDRTSSTRQASSNGEALVVVGCSGLGKMCVPVNVGQGGKAFVMS